MKNPCGGYWGKVLWIDLTEGDTSVEEFDERFARKYLSGLGLTTRILSGRIMKSINPLGPNNVLVFATRPFQATTAPGFLDAQVAFWHSSSLKSKSLSPHLLIGSFPTCPNSSGGSRMGFLTY